MSSRLQLNDRVTVVGGSIHRGKTGVIQARRSTLWVVVFDRRHGGGDAQLPSLSLRKEVKPEVQR